MNTDMRNAISQHLKRGGLPMTKRISSGGLFSIPAYDNRTVYSQKELDKISREGFYPTVDMGIWLFNALNGYEKPKKSKS